VPLISPSRSQLALAAFSERLLSSCSSIPLHREERRKERKGKERKGKERKGKERKEEKEKTHF